MTVLSEEKIMRYIQEDELGIEPFSGESLQPASYDLRAAEKKKIGRHCLLHTLERVEFPMDLAGVIRMRSTFAREGIFFSGGFIDPGFEGNLTLALSNQSNEEVIVKEEERIANLVFLKVEGDTEGYGGRYQDSVGLVDSKRKK